MKRIIVAIALCVSTSAFASKMDGCIDFAETTNAMVQLLQEGHSPSRILAIFKKHSTRPDAMEGALRVAMFLIDEGRVAGPRLVSYMFTECMKLE